MDTLPREIHKEVVSWLAPEEQQMSRLVSRYWAGRISPARVNLLEFGARHGIVDYCDVGLSRWNNPSKIYSIAIRHGHLDVVAWARSRGIPWNERVCSWAAGNGRLEILKWLRGDSTPPQSGNTACPWDETTCHLAALNGHLEVLKYAHESGCPRNMVWSRANAARNGHLEVLKWLRSNDYPWDSETCTSAAEFGHLEILKYARESGCPWDSGTCYPAARKGRLEVLKYAHESGCPWDYQNVDIGAFPKNTQMYISRLRGLGGMLPTASVTPARRW